MATDEYGHSWEWNPSTGGYLYSDDPDSPEFGPQDTRALWNYEASINQAQNEARLAEIDRINAWNANKYSIMTDAINRGISGPEYDDFIAEAKNAVLSGTVNPASPNIISDIVNARSAQQLGDVNTPAGFLNNLLNEYGYKGLQTLSEKDPQAFDNLVASARKQNITLSNIPGVARSTAGTSPDSKAMYGLPTYTDKYNALMDGDFINDNRTGLIDMAAKDPLSYMPLGLNVLAGIGTELGLSLIHI